MSIIEMRDVVKKYDNGTTALRGVSVTVEPGEFAYIVGPSGAGKSTFIRALYREVKIEKGSLTVAGFNLVKIKRKMSLSYVVVLGLSSKIINCYQRKLFMKILLMQWKLLVRVAVISKNVLWKS